jgi:hypothetical protein
MFYLNKRQSEVGCINCSWSQMQIKKNSFVIFDNVGLKISKISPSIVKDFRTVESRDLDKA